MAPIIVKVESKDYKCPSCDRCFSKVSALKLHYTNSHPETPACFLDLSLLCDICLQCFSSKASLNKHYKNHVEGMKEGVKVFQCHECDKSFFSKIALTSHQKRHAQQSPGSSATVHPCEVCGKNFSEYNLLLEHVFRFHTSKLNENGMQVVKDSKQHEGNSAKHPNFTLFACKECKGFFYSNKELELHSASHTPKKPFQCQVCDRGFKSKESLEKHSLTHSPQQNDNAESQDDIAPDEGTNSKLSTFSIHTESSQPETFSCDICEMHFDNKASLDVHCLSHTKEMPFQCTLCLKAFSHESHLRAHCIRHHTPIDESKEVEEYVQHTNPVWSNNPVTLPVYELPVTTVIQFKHPVEEQQHRFVRMNPPKITASGKVKPYQCDKCNRYFALKANLLVHQQNHTKNMFKSRLSLQSI